MSLIPIYEQKRNSAVRLLPHSAHTFSYFCSDADDDGDADDDNGDADNYNGDADNDNSNAGNDNGDAVDYGNRSKVQSGRLTRSWQEKTGQSSRQSIDIRYPTTQSTDDVNNDDHEEEEKDDDDQNDGYDADNDQHDGDDELLHAALH